MEIFLHHLIEWIDDSQLAIVIEVGALLEVLLHPSQRHTKWPNGVILCLMPHKINPFNNDFRCIHFKVCILDTSRFG